VLKGVAAGGLGYAALPQVREPKADMSEVHRQVSLLHSLRIRIEREQFLGVRYPA